MLFPYSQVPNHKLEAMQSIVDYLFNEVWCKALDEEYGLHLFEGHPMLEQIMEELAKRELAEKLKSTGTDTKFYLSVNKIFDAFKQLERTDIEAYRKYFEDNNNIEALCSNTDGVDPVHYSRLDSKYTDLNDEIANFFTTLYGSSSFFGLAFVKELIDADLATYYKDFVLCNNRGVCPFCGISLIDGQFAKTREAYDHFLPKAKYPFNSVNLKNLAPSCNKCNSGNKGEKDPLYDDQGRRRKAFYPFTTITPDLSLTIDVMRKDWKNLQSDDLSIAYNTQTHQDEITTWRALFGIDQRYKDLCCGSEENGGKYWLIEIFDEWRKDGRHPDSYLKTLNRQTKNFPFSGMKFIKKAFLDGCHRAGLFDEP